MFAKRVISSVAIMAFITGACATFTPDGLSSILEPGVLPLIIVGSVVVGFLPYVRVVKKLKELSR